MYTDGPNICCDGGESWGSGFGEVNANPPPTPPPATTLLNTPFEPSAPGRFLGDGVVLFIPMALPPFDDDPDPLGADDEGVCPSAIAVAVCSTYATGAAAGGPPPVTIPVLNAAV